jgi:hypothetical protein
MITAQERQNAISAYIKARGFITPTIGQIALANAIPEIGIEEDPLNNNYDPDGQNRINEYQATTELYGEAWGGSFVSWCFKQAGRPIIGDFNQGLSADWITVSRANNCLGDYGIRSIFGLKDPRDNNQVSIQRLQDGINPGDIVLFDWQRGYGVEAIQQRNADHIGIVEYAPDKSGYFTSIEGNVGTPGGVRRVLHYRDEPVSWARVR